jgi:tRNA modification GTPase
VVFSPADTIVAIATAPGRAGIGVVRLSGPRAHEVARAILTVARDLEPRRATLTHVRGTAGRDVESPVRGPEPRIPESPDRRSTRRIDEVVATYFPAPHSYTAEDVVEISAHGSMVLLREIVRSAVGAGARLAEPGEFTLRAFLNGRLDLVQADAVADLVEAVTPLQARVAFDQLEGTLTRAIGAIDHELFDLVARLEASVDFPEEGYHFVTPRDAAAAMRHVLDGIDALLSTSGRGRLIREGRHIAILGKPNVGKSSLFNQLVGTDRAIVAPGPGTTRDMLRESIDLDGIQLGLVDTAGIRTSDDEVEREGVARARGAAAAADLVVLVLDQSRPIEDIDRALLRDTASATRVVVVNKIDLPAAWEAEEIAAAARDSGLVIRGSGLEPPDCDGPEGPLHSTRRRVAEAASICPQGGHAKVTRGQMETPRTGPAARIVSLSLSTGEGVSALRAAMCAALDVAEPLRDAPIVSNVRHETLLRQARNAIARAVRNVEQAGESSSEELVLADLAGARAALEEVTGRRTTEDVLRRIFERFCIGK